MSDPTTPSQRKDLSGSQDGPVPVPVGVSVRYFQNTISNNPVLPLFSQAVGANDAVIRLIAAVLPLVTGIIITAAGYITGFLVSFLLPGAVTAAVIIPGAEPECNKQGFISV